ncbi:hypothetical protein [Micromonospora thermarum]|uniref:Uncharacterized protein n=1 Tax=Micromonospora thermarum TaxID=2720024 RepID=A0ABX0Z8E2_9ACTN|nr:hypothetical protein [Micromonospora thermarum]NJP33748.1 hypothetical protein [Micromonospora thermarum]
MIGEPWSTSNVEWLIFSTQVISGSGNFIYVSDERMGRDLVVRSSSQPDEHARSTFLVETESSGLIRIRSARGEPYYLFCSSDEIDDNGKRKLVEATTDTSDDRTLFKIRAMGPSFQYAFQCVATGTYIRVKQETSGGNYHVIHDSTDPPQVFMCFEMLEGDTPAAEKRSA